MPDLAAVIALFDQRAQAIASSSTARKIATLGAAASDKNAYSSTDVVQNRIITLELLKQTGSSSTSASPGTPGPSNPLVQIQALSFTVGVGSDGYAQTITITASARQNVHQTVVGNYVDEWAMAPGQLDLDVVVAYNATPYEQVQKFFDLLDSAKRTSPLSNELPLILRYHDTYLQRTFTITQDSVKLEESVERPNMGRIAISAQILFDYGTSQPTAPTTSSTASPESIAATDAAYTSDLQFSAAAAAYGTNPDGTGAG